VTFLIAAACGAAAWAAASLPIALALAKCIHCADPGEDDDLLAMVQPENDPAADDREFHALTDPIEAEIARRWT